MHHWKPRHQLSIVSDFVCYLFRTKTHLLQRHFIFLNDFNSRIFVRFVCTVESHVINFQPFLTSFAIFHAFTDFFELNDHEIENHYKWTLKMLKVGMVSSFHPHSMCKKVERVMAKTWFVQNGQSPSNYQGFERRLICYKGF